MSGSANARDNHNSDLFPFPGGPRDDPNASTNNNQPQTHLRRPSTQPPAGVGPAPPASSSSPSDPPIKLEQSPSDRGLSADDDDQDGDGDNDSSGEPAQSARGSRSKKGSAAPVKDEAEDPEALVSPKKQRAQKRKYRHKVGEKTRRDQTNRLYHQLERNLYRANPALQQTRRSRVVLLEMASEAIERLLTDNERLRHELDVATGANPPKRQKFVADAISPSSTTYSQSSACPPLHGTQFDPATVPTASLSFTTYAASSSLPIPSPPLPEPTNAAMVHTLRHAISNNSLNQFDPLTMSHQRMTILDPMSNPAHVSGTFPSAPNPAVTQPALPVSSPTPSQKRVYDTAMPSNPLMQPPMQNVFRAHFEQADYFATGSYFPTDPSGKQLSRSSSNRSISDELASGVSMMPNFRDASQTDLREMERLLQLQQQQRWTQNQLTPQQSQVHPPQQPTLPSHPTASVGGVPSTPPRGPNINTFPPMAPSNFSSQLSAGPRNVITSAQVLMGQSSFPAGLPPSLSSTSPSPVPKPEAPFQQVMFRCHLNQSGSIISGNDGGIQFLAALLLHVDPSVGSTDALRTNLNHNILAIVSPDEMRRVFDALAAIGNGTHYSICLPNIQLACPRSTWLGLLPRQRNGLPPVPVDSTARLNMVVCARVTPDGVFDGYECAFTFTE